MDHGTLLFSADTIKIYSNRYITNNTEHNYNVDPYSIITIGNYISFRGIHCDAIIVHGHNTWPDLPRIMSDERLLLEYDNSLYTCSVGNACWILIINPVKGGCNFVYNEFSSDMQNDINDFRILIIRYLKSIGREYDPSLIKYPQTVFPEIPKVIPLDHILRGSYGFFDATIRCID